MARDTVEVTYITKSGSYEVRLNSSHLRDVCSAAQVLDASYFVAIDGWDDMQNCPIWSVFDMRSARRNTPVPGEWSIDDPVKTFRTEKPDPAVMWAMMQGFSDG